VLFWLEHRALQGAKSSGKVAPVAPPLPDDLTVHVVRAREETAQAPDPQLFRRSEHRAG